MDDTNAGAPAARIPPDDASRSLTNASLNDRGLRHVALAGDTYTILVSGEETSGRYTLIDMHVPPGGGPPPHRHDFEEMFTILEGELEFTFRGEKVLVGAGRTINVPANAPHQFHNVGNRAARLLCMCSPAGQDEFFLLVGDPVDGPTAPAPELDETQKAERRKKAVELAPKFRTELL